MLSESDLRVIIFQRDQLDICQIRPGWIQLLIGEIKELIINKSSLRTEPLEEKEEGKEDEGI